MSYANIPTAATLNVKPFKAHVSDAKLQHFNALLELSPIAPPVFENTNAGRKLGMTRAWLENAKSVWLNGFDWRKHEDRINSFPNFKTDVKDAEGNVIEVQFLALFSEKTDAIPIALFHGWPGSILEFLDMLDILRNKYTPDELPYHVIVPSLPGYAYSSGPPVDKDYRLDIAAGAMHNLMVGLGFESGYLAQGGDLGSFLSRILAMTYEPCKGIHLNMMGIPPEELNEDPEGTRALEKAAEHLDTAFASTLIQGTRTATVGLVLSSSPLALLAWIGEKFLEWSDEDPPLDAILEAVTLYWMTDTMPRCIYHNRGMGNPEEQPRIARSSVLTSGAALKLPYVEKPTGYSMFVNEIVPVPESWAKKSCNIVSFNQHQSGGHFAAMEKPNELLADVEEYVKKVWKY